VSLPLIYLIFLYFLVISSRNSSSLILSSLIFLSIS